MSCEGQVARLDPAVVLQVSRPLLERGQLASLGVGRVGVVLSRRDSLTRRAEDRLLLARDKGERTTDVEDLSGG